MPPQKNKKKRLRTALHSRDLPFPSLPMSLSFPDIAKAKDTTETRLQIQTPTRPPNNATIYIPIATHFATISSRELSFRNWPHTNIPPQQLAQFGFYYNPCDDGHDNVCYFACGAEVYAWDPVGPYTEEELLEHHEKDCLWADMRRDARLCINDSVQPVPPVAKASSTSTNSPHKRTLSRTHSRRHQLSCDVFILRDRLVLHPSFLDRRKPSKRAACLRIQVLGCLPGVVAVAQELLPVPLAVPPGRPVEESLRSPGLVTQLCIFPALSPQCARSVSPVRVRLPQRRQIFIPPPLVESHDHVLLS
ncbi:hypothetical protein GQ44DRAFT_777736 [Phaeosphaeriaceae sp. PMI808]|nr:hypothetical protein GQ44DRAFT_777736 [Phaeosphaeriaceae sp. PMI808]